MAAWGIRNPEVLQAMKRVKRCDFIDPEHHWLADDDRPVEIGYGQTISAPSVVAFMTEQLQVTPTDRILEIGTGSGYQTAILASLAGEVYTIEFIEPLFLQAVARLQRLGFNNIKARCGDGRSGWSEAAPFDRIIVTCAPVETPKELIDQLRDGGRMILPVGPIGNQTLHIIQKQHGKVWSHEALAVRFVPMLNDQV